jgi:peptidoglycan/LPS O-acetylase OafA/YrhL
MSYTFVVPLLASVAGVAMIWSLCGSGPAGVLGAPWLRYVGRRSYAYYLWHLPLLLLLRAVMDDAVAAVFAVGLTAAIGEISWRLVEARWLGAEPRHPRAPVRAAGDASPTPIAS